MGECFSSELACGTLDSGTHIEHNAQNKQLCQLMKPILARGKGANYCLKATGFLVGIWPGYILLYSRVLLLVVPGVCVCVCVWGSSGISPKCLLSVVGYRNT